MLYDLGDFLDAHRVANVMHETAYLGLLDLADIDRLLGSCTRRIRFRVLAEALELHRSGSAGTRSSLEYRYVAALRRYDAPRPLVNVPILVAGEAIEVDLCWPDHRLRVEVDGPGHDRPAIRRRDAERDKKLRDAGFTVLRCRHDEIESHAQMVANHLALAKTSRLYR
jgi:hypothetical protein